jgi:putative transposase
MARLPRLGVAGVPHHVIQRGNNRQVCFGATEDFVAYAHWLREGALKHEVAVHAWVFMSNHAHLLVTPSTGDGVSKMMQALGRCYVRYFNTKYERSGTLWEGRFRSCVIEAERYLLACQRYIELNPVRAGMVEDPADYRWSSYQVHAMGVPAALHTPHELYLRLAPTTLPRQEAYRHLCLSRLDGVVIKDIRDSLNKGMALGSDRFGSEVERLTGRRTRPVKPGPRPAGKPRKP